MDPTNISLLTNSLTTILSKIVELYSDKALVDPATEKLQEFLQRSYKRKDSEYKLKKALLSALDDFYESQPDSHIRTIFENYLTAHPEVIKKIAEAAISMKSADPNSLPDDFLKENSIKDENAKAQLAKLLFRFRQELAQIDGYAQAISYADNLQTFGMLSDIYSQLRSPEESLKQQVEIKSGTAEIIASGSVIAFNGNPIEISYGPSIERLTLVFAFQDDGQQDTRIDATKPNPNTLHFNLYNFRNPLGSGTSKPVPIGTLAGRKLYLHYRIYDIGNSDKTIHYTIFLSGEIASHD